MKWREIVDENEVIKSYTDFFEEVSEPGIPKYIVGHSLGGLYAMRLAQLNPQYFKGCVLINPLLEFGPAKVSSFNKFRLFINN